MAEIMAARNKVDFILLISVIISFSAVVTCYPGVTINLSQKEYTRYSVLHFNCSECYDYPGSSISMYFKTRDNQQIPVGHAITQKLQNNCIVLKASHRMDFKVDALALYCEAKSQSGHLLASDYKKLRRIYSDTDLPMISINGSKGMFETTSSHGSYEGTVGELIEIKCINMGLGGTLHWEHCYDRDNIRDNPCDTTKSTEPEINQYMLIHEGLADTELHCVYTNTSGQTHRTSFIFKIKKELNIGLICGVVVAVVASLVAVVAVFHCFRRPTAARP